MFSRSAWAKFWPVVWGGALVGCLESRPPADLLAEAEGDSPLAFRIVAPFEGADGAENPQGGVSAASLDSCAETANACLETSDDPVGCIRGYTLCAVGAGLEAEHPFLLCVESLATCWQDSEDLALAEACALEYDDCVNAYLASVSPGPTDPSGPTDPAEPTEPVGPSDPSDLAARFEACVDAGNACLEERPEDELSCVVGYRDCIDDIGAYGPFVGCLDGFIGCAGADGHDLTCYDDFDLCVASAYPQDQAADPDADHEPEPDDYEWAVCEEPTVDCYEVGGTNVECLSVYRSCLIDYGLARDDSRIACLDTLIECAGPAEASADPDTALEGCASDFNACLAEPIE